MFIVLMGPPNSGKSTVASLIREKRFSECTYISTGDLVRAMPGKQQESARKDQPSTATRTLVADNVITPLLLKRLQAFDCAKGVILDGFPRTPMQLQSLITAGIKIDAVLVIDIPDAVCLERTKNRVVGSNGAVYNLASNPPPAGISYNQREDDKEDVMQMRLQDYHDQKAQLLQGFDTQGKLGNLKIITVNDLDSKTNAEIFFAELDKREKKHQRHKL